MSFDLSSRHVVWTYLPIFMLHTKVFVFNALGENTYLIWDDRLEAVLVDPGCYDRHEQAKLLAFVQAQGLAVKAILNTHGHVDHVLGNQWAKQTFGAPLYIGAEDLATLKSVEVYAPMYGFHRYEPAEPDVLLHPEETLSIGQMQWQILFVPGHAAGHIAYYAADAGLCVAGDVLFREGVGRWDLPGGDFTQLAHSIRQVLYALPDTTRILPGHGPHTTIGHEKQHNPYVPA